MNLRQPALDALLAFVAVEYNPRQAVRAKLKGSKYIYDLFIVKKSYMNECVDYIAKKSHDQDCSLQNEHPCDRHVSVNAIRPNFC